MEPTAADVNGTPGLVSVLVPIYNHAKFVSQCLDSIAAEIYPSIEVIAIDDGSSDTSFEVVQNWRQANPNCFERFVLLRQENQGLTRTLNKLILLSRGEYIVPLASDDVLLPGGMGARVDGLRARSHWLAVFGDCEVIDEKGNQLHASGLADLYGADKVALSNEPTIALELILRWSVPGPTLMVRRTAYLGVRGVGLYPEQLVVEDRDLFLRLLARQGVGFVDQRVSRYRLHQTNTIRITDPERKRHYAHSIYLAEKRHIPAFQGIAKLGLWARVMAQDACQRVDERSTLPRRAQRKTTYLALRAITAFALTQNSRRARELAELQTKPAATHLAR